MPPVWGHFSFVGKAKRGVLISGFMMLQKLGLSPAV